MKEILAVLPSPSSRTTDTSEAPTGIKQEEKMTTLWSEARSQGLETCHCLRWKPGEENSKVFSQKTNPKPKNSRDKLSTLSATPRAGLSCDFSSSSPFRKHTTKTIHGPVPSAPPSAPSLPTILRGMHLPRWPFHPSCHAKSLRAPFPDEFPS